MSDTKKNGALVLVSVVLFFIVLEIGLRLGGWAFMQVREARNRAALKNDKAVRILCLGESTTALGGDHAYPRLLERILNETGGERTYRVINRGIPGITTDDIVAGLDDAVSRYSPHIVVTMMGINDDVKEPLSWHDRIPGQLRVVRLFGLIARHVAERLSFTEAAREKAVYESMLHGWEEALAGNGARAEKAFLEQLAQDPDNPESYLDLSSWYAFNGQFNQSLTVLAEGRKKFPDNIDLRLHRGTVYLFQKRWVDAQEVFYEIVQTTEYNDDAYMGLAWAFMQQGKYAPAEELLRENLRLNPRDVTYGALILCYQKQGRNNMADRYRREAERRRVRMMLPGTQENYRQTYQYLHERGIPLIAVQYPRRDPGLLEAILGERPDVVIVDNQADFDAAVARDGYEAYFVNNFAGDFGHGTAAGNRLLAENVAEAVRALVATF